MLKRIILSLLFLGFLISCSGRPSEQEGVSADPSAGTVPSYTENVTAIEPTNIEAPNYLADPMFDTEAYCPDMTVTMIFIKSDGAER